MSETDASVNTSLGVLVILVLGSCFISSAIEGIAESCAPTSAAQCRQACGNGNVHSVSAEMCTCKGAVR